VSTYSFCVGLLRLLLRAFLRRVEVVQEGGASEEGGIFVAWHPNALVDGALILTTFPGRIVVGGRHGLFRLPLLGQLMKGLGMVPVYRREDFPKDAEPSERRRANEKSLDAMAKAVAEGAFALLFPEGESHDAPYLTELRTGAARLFYRAREMTSKGSHPPVIVPVGLHYDRKQLFRSRALVIFHSPFEPSPELLEPLGADATEEERRARYRALTDELEVALREVVHATESWELHYAMHRARKILRAERAHRSRTTLERPTMKERVRAFARLWAGYNERVRTRPEEVRKLVSRIERYESDLDALGIEDHELYGSGSAPSLRSLGALGVQILLVYFVLPPVLLIGYVVNLPAGLLVWAVARWGARAKKDVASLKLVAGALAFPLVWTAAALLVAWGGTRLSALYPHVSESPIPTGALAFLVSAASAFVVLHYQRLARRTVKAIRARLTRWRRSQTLERLRLERAGLYDELRRLARGAG
jgi:1-acyl-sn-glycerol-3-phosphate acyltransferase